MSYLSELIVIFSGEEICVKCSKEGCPCHLLPDNRMFGTGFAAV